MMLYQLSYSIKQEAGFLEITMSILFKHSDLEHKHRMAGQEVLLDLCVYMRVPLCN